MLLAQEQCQQLSIARKTAWSLTTRQQQAELCAVSPGLWSSAGLSALQAHWLGQQGSPTCQIYIQRWPVKITSFGAARAS